MSACKYHIAIIEPSFIVYEGIVSILLNSSVHYHIYKLDSLDEFENHAENQIFDFVLINPVYVQADVESFISIKSRFSNIIWIGICYALFDRKVLEMFSDVVYITDSSAQIVELFAKHACEECTSTVTKQKEVLSEREIQVLEQIVKGLSNKEIADVLHISAHTVISHRKKIIQKTGIKSQSGLTIYALSNKIINLDEF